LKEYPEEESVAELLGQVCKLHYVKVHARLDEVGLHRGQTPVLHALWHQEGLTHSELAEGLHVQPATITKMLERMERAGFVERRPDAEDRRVSRVFLTDAARAIHDDLRRIQDSLKETTFAGFDEADLGAFRAYLKRIRANLLKSETE